MFIHEVLLNWRLEWVIWGLKSDRNWVWNEAGSGFWTQVSGPPKWGVRTTKLGCPDHSVGDTPILLRLVRFCTVLPPGPMFDAQTCLGMNYDDIMEFITYGICMRMHVYIR